MFIEDLTDYKHHRGYQKMHKRRSDFCEKISNKAYRILIAGTSHHSFLDIQYHLAKNPEQQSKALDILQLTLKYRQSFFDRYLNNKNISIDTRQSKHL